MKLKVKGDMKKKATSNLTKRVTVRFSPEEYSKIFQSYKRTTNQRLSEYFRSVMLEKPVTVNIRNQSLDEVQTELIAIKNELRAIGNNFNQSVRKLHVIEHISGARIWIVGQESRWLENMKKLDELSLKISKISRSWLPE
jgi:MobC-like protein